MAKKKNFDIGGPAPSPIIPITPVRAALPAENATFTIPLGDGRTKFFDYAVYLGRGFDDTVFAVVGVLRAMVDAGRPEPHSLHTIVNCGLKNWWSFCCEIALQGNPPTLSTIDGSTMEMYASWLSMRLKADGDRWSKNTARTAFAKTKTILTALLKRKLLIDSAMFPRNPFPGATSLQNRRGYIRPLSDREREHILKPLSYEVSQIYDGTHSGSAMARLCLCVFAILVKTGLNPTPFLEIPRDLTQCFLQHPRINRKILVTFKRRAGEHTMTPLETEETKVVSLDIYKLCERIVELTKEVASEAVGTELEGRLWVYKMGNGNLRSLSTEELSNAALAFSKRHTLIRDDGTRLKMSSQLFRNTRINRIWRLSKGDLLATAKSASNTPGTVEGYLVVTHEGLQEHRLAGEVLVETLSTQTQRVPTPHSGCKDSLNGEFAPKNGEHCIDFISCFRCKSQVILQEDLYKLFSFYWALFSQRTLIGSQKWKELFAWIIRVIDRDITPKFDAKIVAHERQRARNQPHPMWRSDAVLAALRSVL